MESLVWEESSLPSHPLWKCLELVGEAKSQSLQCPQHEAPSVRAGEMARACGGLYEKEKTFWKAVATG